MGTRGVVLLSETDSNPDAKIDFGNRTPATEARAFSALAKLAKKARAAAA